MSKYLVIVESPTKTKTIGKILKGDYKVLASYGHIRDLPKSKIGIDLDTFEMTYVPIADGKKKKIVDELRSAARSAEKVYLCSDPDREGEFIALSLVEMLGIKSKALRATFNEITPKAITNAIASPRQIDDKLVDSQQARRALDRIVGYKLSPLLWKKIKRGLSAGRVQSVAVRVIAEREREISSFAKDEYWTVDGNFNVGSNPIKASLYKLDSKRVVDGADMVEQAKAGKKDIAWLKTKGESDALVDTLRGSTYMVASSTHSEESAKAYPPFSTSHLQMAAANRLGFDAKRTMQVAQGLYEGVAIGPHGQIGLITYMRTDSFSVSKDAADAARSYVVSKYGAQYYPSSPNFYRSKAGSQGAHECIRPTRVDLDPDSIRAYMQPEQHKLYKLIWERFVASQMAPAVYDTQTIEIVSLGKHVDATFRASGRRVKFKGWTLAYGSDDDEQIGLPDVQYQNPATIISIDPGQHFTQPPPRYNDASLVKMLEKEGIGRPSTYASIIQVIQDRKYVEKTGRGGKAPFKATDLGIVVTDSLVAGFPSIMDVGFTREMEQKLDDIEDGTKTYKQVMSSFWESFQKELKEADKKMPSPKGGEKTQIKCPKCSKPMIKLLGSLGFFLKCEDENCKHTQDLDGGQRMAPKPTGLKCDKCGSPVVKSSGRFGDYLCCEGYKDKKCNFTMAINKKGLPQRRMTPLPTGLKCDKCNKGEMVIRVASRKKVPKPFLSCNAFPKCRNAKDLPEPLAKQGEQAMKTFGELRAKDAHDASIFSNPS